MEDLLEAGVVVGVIREVMKPEDEGRAEDEGVDDVDGEEDDTDADADADSVVAVDEDADTAGDDADDEGAVVVVGIGAAEERVPTVIVDKAVVEADWEAETEMEIGTVAEGRGVSNDPVIRSRLRVGASLAPAMTSRCVCRASPEPWGVGAIRLGAINRGVGGSESNVAGVRIRTPLCSAIRAWTY